MATLSSTVATLSSTVATLSSTVPRLPPDVLALRQGSELSAIYDGLISDASRSCRDAPNVGWRVHHCVASTVRASDPTDCPRSFERIFGAHEPMGFSRGK